MVRTPIVFVVDDDPSMRHSIMRLLREVNIQVKAFPNAQEFLAAHDPEQPGCLIIDVRMPGMSGIDVHKHLVEKGHTIPVIIVTGHADVPMAVDALKRGAFDFLEKPLRPQPLLDVVRRALVKDTGNRVEADEKSELLERYGMLTEREIEVIDLIVKGLNNTTIAQKLGVSSQAIDARRNRAMEKLKVASVPQLVQVAVKVQEWL